MRDPSRILRAALGVGIGMLLALHVPSQAGADPLPGDRRFFYAYDRSEDECTQFATQGQVVWDLPGRETVTVSGTREFSPADDPCVPNAASDRQIEVAAFAGDTVLGRHVEPFPADDPPPEYEFTIAAGTAIETVTVAVCLPRLPDGSTWPDRCGPTRTLTLDDALPVEPPCRFDNDYEQWYGGGFLAEIEVIPLESASTGWTIEFDLPESTSIYSLWNGEWTRDGSTVTVTPAAGNGTIQVGDTAVIGLVGQGQPPSTSTGMDVSVDGESCWHVSVVV